MLDKAHAASFWILAFGCLINLGKTFRTPASIAVSVCRSEPLTMFPMERRAGVWLSKIYGKKKKKKKVYEVIIHIQMQHWVMTEGKVLNLRISCQIFNLCSSDRPLSSEYGVCVYTLPWHQAPGDSWAPPVEEQYRFSLQFQCGHCHHQKGRKLPSMHQIRCPCHLDEAAGPVKEASTEAEDVAYQLVDLELRCAIWSRVNTTVPDLTCWTADKGGNGFLFRHRLDRVHVRLRK